MLCYCPNWFEWLSLILTIGSIFAAYGIAKYVYNKEKRDKKQKSENLQESEIKLFKNNILQLRTSINKQIENFEEYKKNDGQKLIIDPDLTVNFLRYLEIKYLYLDKGFDNEVTIIDINVLMTGIYSLEGFTEYCRKEFRDYSQNVIYHENKYLNYRKVLYSLYYKLCNKRSVEFIKSDEFKSIKWKFHDEDKFMKEYSDLRETASVTNNKESIDREKLITNFIKPILLISAKYIPFDYDAIEINDICNEVNSNYNEINVLKEKHFRQIDSYITTLKEVNDNIEKYLNE